MYRRFFFDKSAVSVFVVGFCVPGDHIHTFDDGARTSCFLVENYFQHATLFSLVVAGVHKYRIAFPDM